MDLGSVLIFIFGLVFGSFLNVVIYRVPLGLSVVKPRSACPNCGKQIRGYDNIPVLSWILLRGRCRDCGHPISPRYAIVELLCGFLFVAAYFHAGGIAPSGLETALIVKFCVFFFLLLGLIFIDYDHHLLPDALTFPGIAAGLILSLKVPVGGLPMFVTRRLLLSRWPLSLISLIAALLAAVAAALFIWAVGEIYFRIRHIEGMGFGDVKLMAMVGAFLGLKLTLFTIFAGALLGSVFGLAATLSVWRKRILRRRRRSEARVLPRAWASAKLMLRYYEVPFGVFLGTMAIAAVFIGNPITDYYLRLFP
ncbi:MAG: prepilin peptidase [Acidobacteria bacterium]|nr:prepilin peptidase [Acidobacteriota bacterium]